MNILYVGPYRTSNIIGLLSLNYLLNLSDLSHNLVCRPTFDGTSTIQDPQICSLLTKIENKQIVQPIDLLIQHLDIDSAIYNTKVNKHIFIPILSSKLPNSNQTIKYQQLAKISTILYQWDYQKYILDKVLSQKNNYKQFKQEIHPLLKINNNKQFNFGLYNHYKKYYTIVEHSDDTKIKNLIISFIKYSLEKNQQSCKNDTNICLLLFIQNIGADVLNGYNSFIKNVYNIFGIQQSITKVIIVPVSSDIETMNMIHNCGDIYIELKKNINSEYIMFYDKPYIETGNYSCLFEKYNTEHLSKTGTLESDHVINFENITKNTSYFHLRSLAELVDGNV